MSGRTLRARRRSLGFIALVLLPLAGCAGSKRHEPQPDPATFADGSDLMTATLYLDGIEVGTIPVTVELPEARDYRVLVLFHDSGVPYLLHAERPATVTLDAIAGKLVALDESTGVIVPLEPAVSESEAVTAASRPTEAAGATDATRVASDEDWGDEPLEPLDAASEAERPFEKIELPLLVRLSNGTVVHAQSIERHRGYCRIATTEGTVMNVGDLWIFTIHSATGRLLTTYVMIENHSIP